jgi:hypothetical protein
MAVTTHPRWEGALGVETRNQVGVWKRWGKGVLLGAFYRSCTARRSIRGGHRALVVKWSFKSTGFQIVKRGGESSWVGRQLGSSGVTFWLLTGRREAGMTACW